MEKRVLGKTGIEASVADIGSEGFEGKPYAESNRPFAVDIVGKMHTAIDLFEERFHG